MPTTSTTTMFSASYFIPQAMKLLFSLIIVIADAFVLNIPTEYALLAFLGSLSGAICLTYFERFSGWFSAVGKSAIATIAGMFIGSAIVDYFHIQTLSFIGLTFFASSLLSVVQLRALVTVTKGNSGAMVSAFIERVFNVKLEKKDNKKEKE